MRRTQVSLTTLINLRREGVHYRLPSFQRGFVWDEEAILHCIDSQHRGFPIGSLLLWDTWDTAARRNRTWVIDGQQRHTALTGYRPGETKERFEAHWDLDTRKWRLGAGERTLGLWDCLSSKGYFDRLDRLGGLNDPAVEEAIHAIDHLRYSQVPIDFDEVAKLLAQDVKR